MEWVALLLFFTVIAVLLAGFPVAFTLGGVALIFAVIGVAAGECLLVRSKSRKRRAVGRRGAPSLPQYAGADSPPWQTRCCGAFGA